MPSRLVEYQLLLKHGLNSGYRFMSLKDFWRGIEKNEKLNKIIIIRHDIDTDIYTTKKLFEIENALNIASSYYFRLSTIDVEFMKEIEDCGSEVGYHFEEIAIFAKKYKLKSKEAIFTNTIKIQEMFRKNVLLLRRKTGLPITSIASHGDFVNRKLKIINYEILTDELLHALNIKFEAYNGKVCSLFTSRFSDDNYPVFWRPNNPRIAIDRSDNIIHLLIHPRHWHKNIFTNTINNIVRLIEGISYRL